MKLVFSHPTGNANVRAALMGFAEAGILAEFRTAIASFPGSFLDKLSALGPFSEINRRQFDSSLAAVTKTHPWKEFGRLAALRSGLHPLIKHETGTFSVDAVYQHIDRKVKKRMYSARQHGINAVYAYEDGALESFSAAQDSGIQCLYDLPIGYWRTARKLLEKEKEAWPEWAVTLTGFRDSEAKLLRKDKELSLANRIFVASSFTAQTLKDFPSPLVPIEIIPYGFPPVCIERNFKSFFRSRPLKLLFVGGLSQRKGIANMFAAVEAFGSRIELTVVGHKASNNCPALDAALRKHKWIPSLSHSAILELMRQHDVLLFPSLFEGFGLVITEAMSQGTPVITTDRTAGPDLITSGENGWIIDAGSTEALISQIDQLLLQPEKIIVMGKEAMRTAAARPWVVYGRELANAVQKQKNS